ncbi:MAG: NAD(P)H-dependent oxidoreductase [SAR324 cluster bacterium]|nr:NAD(P)H-dependent oxidoreductase [SAR324 cluster bacterium]MCZ6842950.1 NAD(P)H-dependent oxidoreductase [SAR324 cluster bacterium]
MPSQSSAIQVVAIPGSVRPGNFTGKALAVLADELRQHPGIDLEIIDTAGIDFPLPGMSNGSPAVKRFQETVSSADGIILATPEYHGSFSSVMKLVIENMGFPSGLSGKPVALLGVAAGRIGAIKALEHLRSVCSHVGAIVLPGPISIAGVQQVFDEQGNCLDKGVEQEIRSLAGKLLDYLRESHCPEVPLEEIVRQGSSVRWAPPTQ